MANLKAISIRLKSIKNIQKITASMKMVSAAKFARAERDLRAAKPYGEGSQAFYKGAGVEGAATEGSPKELYVALTSDRGLCGGVHSSICKTIRNELLEKPALDNVGIICVGDKSRAQLGRYVYNYKFIYKKQNSKAMINITYIFIHIGCLHKT